MSLLSSLSALLGGGKDRIDGPQARAMVAEGALLVDVREPSEFSSGHVEGAKNVPVGRIETLANNADLARPVVVYCRSGGRSAMAASKLTKLGFQTVSDLGGMANW
jgi:phage shock protein E